MTTKVAKSKSTKTCTDCNGEIQTMTTMKYEPETGDCHHINPTLCDGYTAPQKAQRCQQYTRDQGCPLHGETCWGAYYR